MVQNLPWRCGEGKDGGAGNCAESNYFWADDIKPKAPVITRDRCLIHLCISNHHLVQNQASLNIIGESGAVSPGYSMTDRL